MTCSECGQAKGHMGGCPATKIVPADSRVFARQKRKAKAEAEGKPGCPPHDWYKLASGTEILSRKKWRTDQCTKCDKKHTYYV